MGDIADMLRDEAMEELINFGIGIDSRLNEPGGWDDEEPWGLDDDYDECPF